MPLDGRLGNTEHLRCLLVRQSGEEPQLHHFRLPGVVCFQAIQGFVEREQLFVVRGGGEVEAVEIYSLCSAAVTLIVFATCIINEDPAHGLGGSGEEVRTVLPIWLFIPAQSQPGFMNQRRGLQGLPGVFARHLLRGELAQFLIDKRQECVRRVRIALIQPLKYHRKFAHAGTITGFRRQIEVRNFKFLGRAQSFRHAGATVTQRN